jgi:hypothetical protein
MQTYQTTTQKTRTNVFTIFNTSNTICGENWDSCKFINQEI